MIRSLIASALAVLLSAMVSCGADAGVKNVNPDEAAKLVDAGKVTVIDVRTPDEFKEGHIKGAKNIDIHDPAFEKQLAGFDKSKPYLVHCQAGGRSTTSLKTFKKLGFTDIYHLNEGFGAWQDAGKPVEK